MYMTTLVEMTGILMVKTEETKTSTVAEICPSQIKDDTLSRDTFGKRNVKESVLKSYLSS